jgi:hypothetical protein
MAEIEIKRTNFFDGQFLKQAEFLDLDAYHVHMRRRWALVLFDQSGVIETTQNDLTVTPVANTKRIKVTAGMAIGKRPDLAEAKEIVLTADSGEIDLGAISANVPTALQAGDTGIVTVHYLEEAVAQPPSEGDVAGNTRIKEHAQITVHRNNLPGPNAANGEPFVILGQIPFTSMTVDKTNRQTAHLNVALVAALQVTMSANTVIQGNSITANVTSSLDLSAVTANSGHITIQGAGITIGNVAHPTTTSLTITLNVAANAAVAAASVKVTVAGTSGQASFTVQAAVAAPTITGPASATKNQAIAITGTNFIAPQNGNVVVTFNSAAPVNIAANQINQAATQISMTVPGAATTGNMTVSAAGGIATAAIVIL